LVKRTPEEHDTDLVQAHSKPLVELCRHPVQGICHCSAPAPHSRAQQKSEIPPAPSSLSLTTVEDLEEVLQLLLPHSVLTDRGSHKKI